MSNLSYMKRMRMLAVPGLKIDTQDARAIYLHMVTHSLGRATQNGLGCEFQDYQNDMPFELIVLRSYVEAKEIFDYFKRCARKWDCMKYIKLQHKVIEAGWNEETSMSKLKIATADGTILHDQCNVLINACGVLKYIQPSPEEHR
jgi:hypothetical protein